MLREHLTPTHRPMPDRLSTVGASEIGTCARQVWFRKQGAPEERETGWGFGERGHVVEAWALERLRAAGVPIEQVQRSIVRGFLSATVDLVLDGEPVDLKSIDPRVTRLPKPAHIAQVQAQAGLLDAPRGHLCYINASDFSDIREFSFNADPELFASLQQRAREIMTAPTKPPAEGRIGGGDECQWCPFQAACIGAPVEDTGKLAEEDRQRLEAARIEIKRHEEASEAASQLANASRERVRDILRAADVRRAPGLARIGRRQNSSLDYEAMEKDGIDLSKYRKPGRVSETVTLE